MKKNGRPGLLGECTRLISKAFSSSVGRKSLKIGYISPERNHISADGGNLIIQRLNHVGHPPVRLRYPLVHRNDCVKEEGCVQPREAKVIARHLLPKVEFRSDLYGKKKILATVFYVESQSDKTKAGGTKYQDLR